MAHKLLNGPHGWIFYVLAALLGISLVCLARTTACLVKSVSVSTKGVTHV